MSMSNVSSTADRILDSAQSLIVSGGYNGFSYADIAEKVGVRKASIHHHFPTKVDLVRTLLERYRAEARAGFDYLDSHTGNARERLSSYLDYWRKCLSERTMCICALLASELPSLPAELTAQVRLHFKTLGDWLEATLQQGQSEGMFQFARSPREEAQTFMATVHGGMLSARVADNSAVFDDLATVLLKRLS
jgi:TetR/AcrR family transcriptional regulator, transcriptional repressor for nem operon